MKQVKKEVKRHFEFLFSRPILKLVILFFVSLIILGIGEIATSIFPPFSFIILALIIFSSIYSVLLIIRIITEYLIRKPLSQLFKARNLVSLVFSYAFFVFGTIFLISLAFMVITQLRLGYLTHGKCIDRFEPSMINQDPDISKSYFYFSAVTLFTIGYGDICPMGLAKYLSILTGFAGTTINTVIMGLVITTYLNRKTEKE